MLFSNYGNYYGQQFWFKKVPQQSLPVNCTKFKIPLKFTKNVLNGGLISLVYAALDSLGKPSVSRQEDGGIRLWCPNTVSRQWALAR